VGSVACTAEPARRLVVQHAPPRPAWRDAEPWLTFGEVVAVHIHKAFIRDRVYDTALA